MTTRKKKPNVTTPALPDAAQATNMLGTLTGLEQSIDPKAPLTPKQRSALDARLANVGEPLIERVSVTMRQRGGTLGKVSFDSDTADAVLAYSHAIRPVAQQCAAVGNRIEDDVRQRVDGVIDDVLTVTAAVRKQAKKDPTLRPLQTELEALRPKATRRARTKAATAPTATAPTATTTPAATPVATVPPTPTPTPTTK